MTVMMPSSRTQHRPPVSLDPPSLHPSSCTSHPSLHPSCSESHRGRLWCRRVRNLHTKAASWSTWVWVVHGYQTSPAFMSVQGHSCLNSRVCSHACALTCSISSGVGGARSSNVAGSAALAWTASVSIHESAVPKSPPNKDLGLTHWDSNHRLIHTLPGRPSSAPPHPAARR